MMPPCGTYDYFAVAPNRPLASDWNLSLRFPIQFRGNELTDKRLVGHAPKLRIENAGKMPSSPPWPDFPDILLSRITLTADNKNLATVSSASFLLDKEITDAICPGDHLHISRSPCGGLGLSLIRDKVLIFAIGAVTRVTLSDSVQAWLPLDLIEEAEAIFNRQDSNFEFNEYPIAVKICNELRFFYNTNQIMSDYVVFVRHGFIVFEPGRDACAAISLIGSCPAFAAKVSAHLLTRSFFDMGQW